MGTTATNTATAHEAHYKDGYQVPEGGDYDYIVRAQSTEKTKRWDMHILIRAADERVIGTYCGRASACKRAQALGGNTSFSRRREEIGRERNAPRSYDRHAARAEYDAYGHNQEIMGPASVASDAEKAIALRAMAAYLPKAYAGSGYISTGGAEDIFGVNANGLNKLVKAGKLSRKRTVGWVYNLQSIVVYALELANQLECGAAR